MQAGALPDLQRLLFVGVQYEAVHEAVQRLVFSGEQRTRDEERASPDQQRHTLHVRLGEEAGIQDEEGTSPERHLPSPRLLEEVDIQCEVGLLPDQQHHTLGRRLQGEAETQDDAGMVSRALLASPRRLSGEA